MDLITDPLALATAPAIPTLSGTRGYYSNGNPLTGTPATSPPDWHVNSIQCEIVNCITQAGLTPDHANWTQLFQALKLLFGGGRLLNIQKFQTVGSSVYTSTPGTNQIIGMVQAGGGGGAGCIINFGGSANCSIGTPGGGGAFGSIWLTSGFSGVTVTVGDGGTGGTGGSNGTAGGNSSFGSLVVATGGYYGSPGASASVGTSGGQGNVVGQTGANLDSRYGGLGTQSFVYHGVLGAGGNGGSSFYGDGGAGASTNTNGNNAGNAGSGGGGTCGDLNSATLKGGNGAPGKVEIYEFS